jgi:hypothetical protein
VSVQQLTPEQQNRAMQIAAGLIEGFTWRDTPEGSRFWDIVYNRLLMLAGHDPTDSYHRRPSCQHCGGNPYGKD